MEIQRTRQAGRLYDRPLFGAQIQLPNIREIGRKVALREQIKVLVKLQIGKRVTCYFGVVIPASRLWWTLQCRHWKSYAEHMRNTCGVWDIPCRSGSRPYSADPVSCQSNPRCWHPNYRPGCVEDRTQNSMCRRPTQRCACHHRQPRVDSDPPDRRAFRAGICKHSPRP